MKLSLAETLQVKIGINTLAGFDSRRIFGAHIDALRNALEAGRIEKKSGIIPGSGSGSTVFGDTLYLSTGFFNEKVKPAEKAAILVHEAVHFWQWKNKENFLYRYLASPRFRFEMEAAAERPQTYFMILAGMIPTDSAKRQAWIKSQAKQFQSTYWLWFNVSCEEIAGKYARDIFDCEKGEAL